MYRTISTVRWNAQIGQTVERLRKEGLWSSGDDKRRVADMADKKGVNLFPTHRLRTENRKKKKKNAFFSSAQTFFGLVSAPFEM